jgi:hypothetical protein
VARRDDDPHSPDAEHFVDAIPAREDFAFANPRGGVQIRGVAHDLTARISTFRAMPYGPPRQTTVVRVGNCCQAKGERRASGGALDFDALFPALPASLLAPSPPTADILVDPTGEKDQRPLADHRARPAVRAIHVLYTESDTTLAGVTALLSNPSPDPRFRHSIACSPRATFRAASTPSLRTPIPVAADHTPRSPPPKEDAVPILPCPNLATLRAHSSGSGRTREEQRTNRKRREFEHLDEKDSAVAYLRIVEKVGSIPVSSTHFL